MCTLQTDKLCYNAININHVLVLIIMQNCKPGELNLSSVMVLRKGVCSLFILLKLRRAVHVEKRISKKSDKSYVYSGIELELAWSKVYHST